MTSKTTLMAFGVGILLSTGCAVTRYERTVTVQRDANGNVVSSSEVEHMSQTGKRKKLPTQYLYGKHEKQSQ